MFVNRAYPVPVVLALVVTVLCSASARAANPPDVRGLLATPVSFRPDTAEKLATSSLDLLAACTFSLAASEAEWLAIRECHLHFKFDSPREVAFVTMTRPAKIEVAEMVITFPLSSGRIWVRSGDEYFWFAKWPCQQGRLENPIQLLLNEAIPDK